MGNARIKSRYLPGFTIVELLIVIVIIAILAAITVVAYNGIQERARISSALAFEHQLRSKYLIDATGDWSFDECSGTSVKNSSNTATTDTITYTTAPNWVTDTATGKGCALNFNGATRIETQATLGTTYYVKGAWIRITAASCGSYNIISQAAAAGGVIAAFYAPNCRPNAGHNGTWNTVQSSTALNDGKWHYVAVIWENGTLTLYVDGKTIQSAAAAVPTNAATGTVAIGAHVGGNYFVGDIDNPFVASQ